MALATLSIDLVAKLGELQAGFDRAQHMAEKNAAAIGRAYDGLKSAAIGIGAAIGGAFSIGGLVSFIERTNEGVGALRDLKTATGASVENLSALEDIARRSGASFESVESTLLKFNKALTSTSTAEFSQIAEILKRIGLNAEDLKRIDPAEAMRQVAVAFSKFADDGNKAREVQIVFGKSLKELAKFMDDLATQTKLTGTVTTQAADEAKRFSDQLASLGKDATDASRALVGPMVSALNDLIAKMKESDDAFSRLKVFGSATGFGALFKLLPGWDATPIEKYNTEVANLTERLKDLNLTQAVRLGFEKRLAELMATPAVPPAVAPKGGDRVVDSRPSVGATPFKPGTPTTEKISETERYIRKLTDETIALLTVSDAAAETEKALLELALNPKFAGATEAEKKALLSLADGLDQLKAKFDQVSDVKTQFRLSEVADTEKVNEALRQQTLAQTEAFHALIAATPTAQLEETRRIMMQLGDAFERGEITVEQFTEAVQTKLGTLPQNFKSDMQKLGEETAASIEDALGDSLLAIFEHKTESILDIWANMLKRLAAQALQAELGNKLFGSFGQKGGSNDLGGWIGQLLSMFGSSGSSSSSSPSFADLSTRASGGPVAAGSTYLVGEKGPELLRMGTRPGNILPTDMLGAGGGLNLTFNIASGVSHNELAAMVPGLTAHIKAEVQASMRRPGGTWRG